MPPTGTVLICDDLRVEITQKLILIGVYNANLIIPVDPFPIRQLVFYFQVESDIKDRIIPDRYEVMLPEQDTITFSTPPLPPELPPPVAGATKWIIRLPMFINNPVLKPGKIRAVAIYNGEEIECSSPWIELMSSSVPT